MRTSADLEQGQAEARMMHPHRFLIFQVMNQMHSKILRHLLEHICHFYNHYLVTLWRHLHFSKLPEIECLEQKLFSQARFFAKSIRFTE